VKRIDIVKCFWCETEMVTEDALIDLQTGKIKCRACLEFDRAVRLTGGS
jgi:hypothetical protein